MEFQQQLEQFLLTSKFKEVCNKEVNNAEND